jgi:hypothetical protein
MHEVAGGVLVRLSIVGQRSNRHCGQTPDGKTLTGSPKRKRASNAQRFNHRVDRFSVLSIQRAKAVWMLALAQRCIDTRLRGPPRTPNSSHKKSNPPQATPKTQQCINAQNLL